MYQNREMNKNIHLYPFLIEYNDEEHFGCEQTVDPSPLYPITRL